MKRILILPAWVKKLDLYYPNEIILKVGKVDEEAGEADVVAGLSLGALIILRAAHKISGKIVLINPPLPKRSIGRWLINWLRFNFKEGIFSTRRVSYVINPLRFLSALVDCIQLLCTDFSVLLEKIPKDRIVVIKGDKDNFFCDKKAVEFLKSKDIRVIEVPGGHNLNKEMETALVSQIL